MFVPRRWFAYCVMVCLAGSALAGAQELGGVRLGLPVGVDERVQEPARSDMIPLENKRFDEPPLLVTEAPLPEPVFALPPVSRIPTEAPADGPDAILKTVAHQSAPASDAASGKHRHQLSWMRGEYLVWQTSGQHIAPLVTTSPAGTPLATAGLLGEPTTTVLFGGQRYDGDWRSGGRFTFGTWLDERETVGVQGRFLMLENETNYFAAASIGLPILAIPLVDPSGTQQRFVAAYPGVAIGGMDIHTSSRLHAADVNAVINLSADSGRRCDALIGWRHMQLGENLHLRDLEVLLGDGELADLILVEDHFVTRNQFHGLDLGLSGAWRRDIWSLDVLAKIALGVNRQTVDISGTSYGLSGAALPGGIFALSSNSGKHTSSVFAVAPEINLNVGCQVTRNFRLFVGYSFLYLNNVVRPGTEIDTTINPNLLPPASPGGPARPAVQFRDTDFWAQGISLGGEFRW